MTKITYIENSGIQHVVDVEDGISVMEGALRNNITSINGECGGGLACATCHVYIDDNWIDKTGVPSEMEISMLDFSVTYRRPTSRLACQISVNSELNGLIVMLPYASTEDQFKMVG